MPRPMSLYRSGIVTKTVSRWMTCPTCGAESYRSRRFEGPLAEHDAATWAPDPRCAKCLRSAMRAEAGL